GHACERRTPEQGALPAKLRAAFERAGARDGIVKRDHRQGDHALWRIASIFGEPVVIDTEAVRLQFAILDPENTKPERCVEDIRLDAVEFVILEPLGRVPAARPG